MDVKQIENEALALPEPLRAGLVWRLLQSLPPSDIDVSDEEALQRDHDLESGAVAPLSHEEFVRRVKNRLVDAEDLLELRKAKRIEGKKRSISLAEVKRQLGA